MPSDASEQSPREEESGNELESGRVEEDPAPPPKSPPRPRPSPAVDPTNRYIPRKFVMSFRILGSALLVAALAMAFTQARHQSALSGEAKGVVAETPREGDCRAKIAFDACSGGEGECKTYRFESECHNCVKGAGMSGVCGKIDDSGATLANGIEEGFEVDVLYDPDDPSEAKIASNVPKPWMERVVPTGIAGALVLSMTLPCAVRALSGWREQQIHAARSAY